MFAGRLAILSLIVLLLIPGSGFAAEWITVNKSDTFQSSTGKVKLTYSFVHPKSWPARERNGAWQITRDKKSRTGMSIMIVHKGDRGAEQLLNQKNGLQKWIARVQPGLKHSKTTTVKIMKREVKLFHYGGYMGTAAVATMIVLLRVGDANIVLLAISPIQTQSANRKTFYEFFKRFSAKLQ